MQLLTMLSPLTFKFYFKKPKQIYSYLIRIKIYFGNRTFDGKQSLGKLL